jgi:hypothetical protein
MFGRARTGPDDPNFPYQCGYSLAYAIARTWLAGTGVAASRAAGVDARGVLEAWSDGWGRGIGGHTVTRSNRPAAAYGAHGGTSQPRRPSCRGRASRGRRRRRRRPCLWLGRRPWRRSGIRRRFRRGRDRNALNAAQRKRAGAAAEFEALKARSSVFVDVVCHGPADFALRRHSSVARRSAVVIVLAIGKPSPRPCLESSQSPSGVPAARSTRTMAQ